MKDFKRQPLGFLLLAMQLRNTGYLRSSQPAAIWASRHAYVLLMSIRALHGRNALLIYTGLRRFTFTGGPSVAFIFNMQDFFKSVTLFAKYFSKYFFFFFWLYCESLFFRPQAPDISLSILSFLVEPPET